MEFSRRKVQLHVDVEGKVLGVGTHYYISTLPHPVRVIPKGDRRFVKREREPGESIIYTIVAYMKSRFLFSQIRLRVLCT